MSGIKTQPLALNRIQRGMPTIPASTYRLQLHESFTFADAAAIAPYLSALGISHVYSSPYLQAAPHSMHGYDVVDHHAVNEELGGADAHAAFSKTLGENNLGQILDIVPNHMAIGPENKFWWDILENGISSRYAGFFDIDWNIQEARLRDKVLVPVLGEQYGKVLASGGITLKRSAATFLIEAAGQTFPLAPTTIPGILIRAQQSGPSDTLAFIAASFLRLPTATFTDRPSVIARHRDKLVIHTMLQRLCADDEDVCRSIDKAVAEINADPDALDELLSAQHYRLAWWKTADQQLGYRRFFDVNNLIGLRMEREGVFNETHSLILEWLSTGVLDGVRIDHPDGLRDPLQYFQRLRAAAPDAWIVGEKILAAGEYMRESWPIDGTSGYDFLNVANGVLQSPRGLQKLTEIYAAFTQQPVDFPAIAHDKKIAVTEAALGSDVNRLTSIFVDLCEQNRNQRDSTRADIRRAIGELAACFSVYRTYVFPGTQSSLGVPARAPEITDEDRDIIARAVSCARENRPEIDPGLFDFFEQVLTLQIESPTATEFILRFQQFSSPVMAKGVEDTAFYCYDRLTSLCEVGADPARNGLSIADFHAYNQRMQATHPQSMTTLSTHDTKRADDVRARLAVLTEVPEAFNDLILKWNFAQRTAFTGTYPDPNTEYFLYQTLIGAWPIDAERTKAYMQKAMREGKQQTSWVNNNKPFEEALNHFIDCLFADENFKSELAAFIATINEAGRINSLTQTLLKHTSPGVPDLYQGSELWDHSLVDPDNRRPVDYQLRTRLLAELPRLTPAQIMARMEEGLPKLHLIHTCLKLRRNNPELFIGPYTPLSTLEQTTDQIIAYQRGNSLITIAPVRTMTPAWQQTTITLPPGTWTNLLTNETHPAGPIQTSSLLQSFPVALLHKSS